MPLKKCSKDGKEGWKYGDNGYCYTGKNAKKDAIKQGYSYEPEKVKKYLSKSTEFSYQDLLDIFFSNPENND